MAEVKKVKIKLPGARYVGGKLRQAGEEVEVREELAETFLIPDEQPEAETLESLTALSEAALRKIAKDRGVEVTKDNDKAEIAQKILDANK